MKIAIYSRGVDATQYDDVVHLINELIMAKVDVLLWKPFLEQLQSHLQRNVELSTFDSYLILDDSYDAVISVGGDGTLLDTITLVRNSGTPIIGINFGRLGFLASLGKEDIKQAVASLVKRNYQIDERSLVHVDASIKLFEDVPYGINEFAIHKTDISPMIKIHTYLNGELLTTYWADGLIVSTPTGSTGYSLSCGGPIVFPDCNSFVITPVAPHNLNIRPIVVPDDTVLSFEVEGRAEQFICALDARRELVNIDTSIAVRKEKFTAKVIRLTDQNFLQTLRNKLNWGLDKRN
jgi:NAD+ kinase